MVPADLRLDEGSDADGQAASGMSLDAQTINAGVSALAWRFARCGWTTRNAVVRATSCHAAGAFDMTTGNGAIVARDCSAQKLDGETSNSKVSLAGVRAEVVSLESSNGAIDGRGRRSRPAGLLDEQRRHFAVQTSSAEKVSASTNNGRVTLQRPARVAVHPAEHRERLHPRHAVRNARRLCRRQRHLQRQEQPAGAL